MPWSEIGQKCPKPDGLCETAKGIKETRGWGDKRRFQISDCKFEALHPPHQDGAGTAGFPGIVISFILCPLAQPTRLPQAGNVGLVGHAPVKLKTSVEKDTSNSDCGMRNASAYAKAMVVKRLRTGRPALMSPWRGRDCGMERAN